MTILAEKLKKLLKQIKYPCNIRSKDLAQGNAVVFILILEYFLKSYSQVLADFFRAQTKLVSSGVDVLSSMKPVSDGGAPSFFALVLQVFNQCFKYESPLTLAQFFDTTARAQSEAVVTMKSQMLIDILTYGLTYQSQHLAHQAVDLQAVGLQAVDLSGNNPAHLVSIQQDRARNEEELMSRGQVNDTPAFIR